tara:strand:+ start:3528 stop:3767 length:240 start_codon:yes stop_codon:yes gene_type:complete
MKYLILIPFTLFFSHIVAACDFFDKNSTDSTNVLMGKKSQFYDVYKQSKCVLEEILSTLPKDQREVIANLIARTYKSVN